MPENADLVEPGDLIDRIARHREAGRLAEALADAAALAKLAPEDPEVHRFHAGLLHEAGRPAEARAALERAVDLDPMDARTWHRLGETYETLDHAEKSIAALARATSLDPSLSAAWFALASQQVERSPAESLHAIDRALALDPALREKATAHLIRGLALSALERFDEALAALEAAGALTSKEEEHAILALHRANALNCLTRYEEALRAAERAEPSLPVESRAALCLQKGIALNGVNRPAEAVGPLAEAERVLADTATILLPRVWLELGVAHLSLGSAAEAHALLARAADAFQGASPLSAATASFQDGRALMELRQYDDAIAAFERVVALLSAPPLQMPALVGPAWAYTGRALQAVGRPEEAVTALDSALAVWPFEDRGELYRVKVSLLGSLKRHEEALAVLDEAVSRDPRLAASPTVWSQRGGLLLALERFDEAVAEPVGELRHHPMTLALRGAILLQLKRPGALDLLREATHMPEGLADQPLAWVGVALGHSGMGRASESLQAMERAFELQPELARDPELRTLYAVSLNSGRRFDEALAQLEGVPESALVTITRAMAVAGLGRTREALPLFDRAVSLADASPRDADMYAASAWLQKANALLGLDELEEARVTFERAAERASTLPEYHPARWAVPLGASLTLWKQGRKEKALEMATEAARLSEHAPPDMPARGVAYWAKGIVLSDLERDDEALLALRRAVELEPGSMSHRVSLAQAYQALEDHARAEREYRRALELEGEEEDDRFEALVGLGTALRRQHRLDDAVGAYRQALELGAAGRRQEWKLWLGLGESYRLMGRYDAASRALRHPWERERHGAHAAAFAVALGAVLLDQKSDQQAAELLTRAAAGAKPDARLEYNLGIALHRLRKPGLARERWRKAAELGMPVPAELLAESPRSPGATWVEFWFGAEVGAGRRALAALLLLLGVGVSLLPLFNTLGVPWLAAGVAWQAYLIALAPLLLLLLPALGGFKLGLGPISLEPPPAGPPASRDTDADMEHLRAALEAVGPGVSVSPPHVDTAAPASLLGAGPGTRHP